MGATTSTGIQIVSENEFGSITVSLASEHHYPGEAIEGKAKLTIEKKFPGEEVWLLIYGEENTHYSTKPGKHRHHHYGKAIVCNTKSKLCSQTFEPNEYEIAFNFQLNENASPSFICRSQPGQIGYHGELNYFILVYLETQDKTICPNDLTAYAPLDIRSKIAPQQLGLAFEGKNTGKLECCCCCSRGKATINFEFIRDLYYYGKGPGIKLKLSVDNQEGSDDINGLNAEIYRFLTLRNNDGRQNIKTQQLSNNHITDYSVSAGATGKEVSFYLPVPDMLDIVDGKSIFTKPTMKGTLVECDYQLKFRCSDTPGFCKCCQERKLAQFGFTLCSGTPPPNTETDPGIAMGLALARLVQAEEENALNEENGGNEGNEGNTTHIEVEPNDENLMIIESGGEDHAIKTEEEIQ